MVMNFGGQIKTHHALLQFRELYHPFIGQSENDRLECIKNLYPQLEDGQKELEQNVPVIVALNSRWKPYFELALTEVKSPVLSSWKHTNQF